jgi:hypothetical protein
VIRTKASNHDEYRPFKDRKRDDMAQIPGTQVRCLYPLISQGLNTFLRKTRADVAR